MWPPFACPWKGDREMKKRVIVSSVIAIFAAVAGLLAGPTRPLRLDWDDHVNPRACDASGPPVIDITMKVKNDADSGVAGNYWAFDSFNKHIRVWRQAEDGEYCSIVEFTGGKFVAQAGQTTPGSTLLGQNVFTSNDPGTFEGGYIATFTGTPLGSPLWKTHGNVGTIDYRCDLSGNCPGVVDWIAQYFSYSNFAEPWWGWIYRDGKDVWVNSISANLGDIR